MSWLNSDGLYIKFGQEEGVSTKGGTYGDVEAGQHVVEFTIDLTALTTSAETILSDTTLIPKGYQLTKVELVNTVAATSGGSATLDVGFIRASDRSTAVDADGAIAAAALSTFNTKGETVTYTVGSTGAGALIAATAAI